MAGLRRRFIFWVKHSALANDTAENMGENGSFAIVWVIGKWKALFEAAFAVRANKMGEASDDKLAKLCLFLGNSHFLEMGVSQNLLQWVFIVPVEWFRALKHCLMPTKGG